MIFGVKILDTTWWALPEMTAAVALVWEK